MTHWLHVPFTILLPLTACAETIHRELLIHFAKDRHEIEDASSAALTAFLSELQLTGDVTFLVHGHTDSDGGQAYNDTLARLRAEAVRAVLLEHGVASSCITIRFSGEREPLAANSSASSMAKNRRVSLVYMRRVFKDIRDIEAALAEGSVQSFSMDPDQDLHWTGTHGTILFIPAGTLTDNNGLSAKGAVTMEVIEALDVRSVVGHSLSTRTRDRLLETGGMVRISAKNELGTELSVRPGGSVRIEIPAPMPARDMQLFTSLDGGTWEPTGQWLTLTTAVDPGQRAFDPPTTNRTVRMPVYHEDQEGRPVPPFRPFRPIEPARPERRNLVPTKGSKRRIQQAHAQEELNYTMAMARYHRRYERYMANLRRYEADVIEYPKALDAYAQEKAEWDSIKAVEYQEWMETRFLPYQRATSKVLSATYAREVERYNAAIAAAGLDQRVAVDQVVTSPVELTTEARDQMTMSEIQRFVAVTNQLGWVNCDRFVPLAPIRVASLNVIVPELRPMRAWLISGETRTVLELPISADGTASVKFPKYSRCKLIAFSVVNGQVQVFDTPVNESVTVTIEFRESTFVELGNILDSLDQWSI